MYYLIIVLYVIKKFLLKIPGGIFGPEAEANLLEVLDMPNKQDQYDRIQRYDYSLHHVILIASILLFHLHSTH